MQYPASVIDHLIQHRRSVKPDQYSGTPVDESIILQMLENARWAPTHGMTEPWRFTVFTGNGLRRFAEFTAKLYKSVTPADRFLEHKYTKLLSNPLKASHLILIGMKRQQNGKIPEVEEICAVACAVQNMQLTAKAHGAVSYWSTGGVTYDPQMKKVLGLEETDLCLGMLYIGNYNGAELVSPRAPAEDKTVWVKD